MQTAPGTLIIQELPNNQIGDLHLHNDKLNDKFNDQRHEFPPAQQMAHAQELPLGRSNSRQELPLNTKSNARGG